MALQLNAKLVNISELSLPYLDNFSLVEENYLWVQKNSFN